MQLHAIEAARDGNVAFEVEVEATLPQAVGYPGTAKVTDRITIPKSTWEEQIAQVASSAALEMAVPYPKQVMLSGRQSFQDIQDLIQSAAPR
ncbi:hypothetical protein [Streptomyces griseoluteus]|uniref:hypothetical protein n=1 Tax=Streptomyces griseoluteus TaxID=29306 RepID=UPI00381B5DAE